MRRAFFAAGSGLVAVLAASFLGSPAAAQHQIGPVFKPGAVLSSASTTLYDIAVSKDQKAGDVRFSGLENQLDGIGAPLFATRIFTLSVPLAGAEKGVKIALALQGWNLRLKGTEMSLLTTVNGQAHVMDFAKHSSPSGDPVTEGCSKPPSQNVPKRPDIAIKPGPTTPTESDSSFMQCILFDVPSASDLRVNIVLVMHRHNQDTAGYLNVATISAAIQP